MNTRKFAMTMMVMTTLALGACDDMGCDRKPKGGTDAGPDATVPSSAPSVKPTAPVVPDTDAVGPDASSQGQ